MKERAAKLVEKNIKELSIKTFHSFCAYFLRHEITYTLGYPSSFIIYDEDDSKDKIKEACVAYGLEKKDKLVGEALNYIYAMKGLGKYPNDIKLNQRIFRDEKKLLDIYKIYESLKFDDKALDFDDLILKTIEILKNFDDVRFKWQRYYRHILIDEFQDTNDLQYELVNLLMTPQTSLYVVCDPDQTIYTWRGANQNIILDLNKKYPSLRTIILKQNYRSTKTILDCSNLLINHNKYRVKKDLVTDNEKGADIDVFSGFTRNEEADWVSRKIIELKAKNPGFSFNDVAVLFRNSYLSSSFENKFTMSRIPYVIYGGIRFYQRKEVKIALSYFRLAVNLDEDFSFYKIINEPKRKIGDQTVLLIQDESKSHGLSAYSYIKNIENYPETKLKFSVLTSLNVMIKKLEDAHERLLKKDEAVVAILKDLIDEIGLEEYLLTLENGEERIQNLRALFDQLTSFFK
jgi:DNA helicase-2/ATP-dependent DNA helicase PcrA